MLLIFVKGMDRLHLLTDNKWAVRALMTPAFQELYKHIYFRLLNVFVNSLSSLQLKCQQFVNYNLVNIWNE